MRDVSRALITGGAGFIGSALVRHLVLQERSAVTVLDKLTYAGSQLNFAPVANFEQFTFIKGDICDAGLVADVLTKFRPDVVFHLAAESHVDRSIDGPSVCIRSNVVGTAVLLEAVREYWGSLPEPERELFRLVHVSTDEVYGSLGADGYFTEDSPYQPNSPYAASKAAADHLARAWHKTYGLPIITTNCSNNYGPYQLPEKLIPLTIINANLGKPVPVYGHGKQIRNWLHVDDHVRGLLLAARLGGLGETYVFGGLDECANIEIVKLICGALDKIRPIDVTRQTLITHVVDRPGHDHRYAIDSSKSHAQLGWSPRVDFTSGIEATIQWYLENVSWVERTHYHAFTRQGTGR